MGVDEKIIFLDRDNEMKIGKGIVWRGGYWEKSLISVFYFIKIKRIFFDSEGLRMDWRVLGK